jgi:GT2 family glycosyltransferase
MGRPVEVIITNLNGRRLLAENLNGLRRQVFKSFSVTLVDNGSRDGSIDFVRGNYPEVNTIALSRNVGFASATNLAIEKSTSEFVALLNNDAVPHPQWLKELVDALKTHPEAGFAASKMLLYHRPELIDRAGDGYTRSGTGVMRGHLESAERHRHKEWIFGACGGAALYRAGMLNDIGLFDDDFFLLYEDVDLSFRAQLKGYRCVYVPGALVYHRGSRTIVRDSTLSVYYGHRNLEWTYLKNMPRGLLFRTLISHILYDMAALLFFTARGRGKDFMRSKGDALKGLKGVLQKRKLIQRNKRVDDQYLWGLLEKESFVHRLKRRAGVE